MQQVHLSRNKHKYTKELIEPIVKESRTWGEVCRKLGIRPFTGSQTHLKKVATNFCIDYSHFVGRAVNKGRRVPPKRPIKDYLILDCPIKITGSNLKRKLIIENIKTEICEICGRIEWMGEKIPLEIDHINGNHSDNRLENLRIICPNCHAQTPTYASKNRSRIPTR